jgi:hypothetical protein
VTLTPASPLGVVVAETTRGEPLYVWLSVLVTIDTVVLAFFDHDRLRGRVAVVVAVAGEARPHRPGTGVVGAVAWPVPAVPAVEPAKYSKLTGGELIGLSAVTGPVTAAEAG